ncbi:MAG: ATP-binding protein [Patulibacter minatonensis]
MFARAHRLIEPWPLRARLTAAFVVVMALVLALGGGFIYVRLGKSLDNAITLGLRGRADDLRSVATDDATAFASGRSELTERGEHLAQRLSPAGRILDATPGLRTDALLTAGELRRALAGREVLVDHRRTGAGSDSVRLLAVRIDGARGDREVLVVGTSTEESREALTDAGELMLLGGPFVLLLASLAGYLLAGAALRPVEQLRRGAEAIRATHPGERLEVPAADDEIHRLALTLNDLLGRIEAAVEVERTFVADASHELRTPLAILKAELEYALRPARTGEEHLAALGLAAEETDRLVQLAEDLLVIARSQGGELALRRAPVSVAELAGTVLERHRRTAGERGIELAIGTITAGPALLGDQLRLEQALGNLVDNAIGHAAAAVTVSARWDDDRDEYRVAVLDDGAGFPEDFLPHAFERFTRADKARGRGGSGLGLSIVDAIASAHGGRAIAENLTGRGACVTLVLPAEPEGGRPCAS